jgi:hypothetical protein
MTREDLQQQGNAILDEMYKAKTQDEWETEMRKLIPLKVEAQKNGWTDWLEAVQKRVDKQRQFKQPYWEKMKNKNQFQSKPKMMFSEETDRAIGDFFRIASEYLKLKMN